MYQYKEKDFIYDIESLHNIFTCAQFNPFYNSVIISYIDDDHLIDSLEAFAHISQKIREVNPALRDTHVYFENLADAHVPTPDRMTVLSFAKRFGVACEDNVLNRRIPERATGGTIDDFYYPVKDTDPDYDEHHHGRIFGYNSTNYDLTMLAFFLSQVSPNLLNKALRPDRRGWNSAYTPNEDEVALPDAATLRAFNNTLFRDYKSNMPSALIDEVKDQNGETHPVFKTGWTIRKGWLLTNRFIDVACLNEKQRRISLKRLSGVKGLQILESQRLANGHDRVDTIFDIADLLAYNLSDVLNTKELFEDPNYMTPFELKSDLLERFPQTVYKQKPGTYEANIQPLAVRNNRLTSDSTSAKFIERVIAPYNKLQDQPAISFLYPSKVTAKRLGVRQTNVLDDSLAWAEAHIPGGRAAFLPIYNFYKELEGKNVNDTIHPVDENGVRIPFADIKEIMGHQPGWGGTNYFYRGPKGKPTASMVTFSAGGIHGAEIKLDLYLKKLDEWKEIVAIQNQLKEEYNGDATLCHRDNHPVMHTDGRPLTDKKGKPVKSRKFLKSGSTGKHAEWRTYKMPDLFKREPSSGQQKLRNEYAYVSVGPASHEDFSSYYPLLLSMLSVFLNPVDGSDPYYDLYKERLALKARLKTLKKGTPEFVNTSIKQNAMKLLLNAASGAGDAKFESNIRRNNAVVSMRIIGQLFAWRIGQAEALAGARVPSTNTDGLYTMGISPEQNDKILAETVKAMYIKVDPETLDRFVTKDSNNRMEYDGEKIASAKGGTLTSHAGPSPTQNLSHPAAIDHALAEYLAKRDNPADAPFDRTYGKKLLKKIIAENKPAEALRYFQWILASSTGSHRYIFLADKERNEDGRMVIQNVRNVTHINRVFLTRRKDPDKATVAITAARRKVNRATAAKRRKKGLDATDDDPIAVQILAANDYVLDKDNDDEAYVTKISGMPEDQNVTIENHSLITMAPQKQRQLLASLDLDAYLEMLERTFTHSWYNGDEKAS